jgi:phosphoribosylanthranilate isomerase
MSHRGWIKICGMTTPEAVAAAVAAEVDAIGFVFAPSVRRVTAARASELAQPARDRVSCIAVTQHPSQAEVDEIVNIFRPDMLQTDIDDLDRLRLPQTLPRLPVLRAGSATTISGSLPARLLFEGPRSGSGQASDWEQAAELARQTQLLLAGGLNADNVAAAIAKVRPAGVDTSSGVEASIGLKSPAKMAEFVRAARAAFARLAGLVDAGTGS